MEYERFGELRIAGGLRGRTQPTLLSLSVSVKYAAT
jgi:hypothetical protein